MCAKGSPNLRPRCNICGAGGAKRACRCRRNGEVTGKHSGRVAADVMGVGVITRCSFGVNKGGMV